MSRVRLFAWIGVAAGIALAGVTGRETTREPIAHDGYIVLAGDFHVHGFPDGIPPWDAVREARRRRLDVIALTSHNSMTGWWQWTHAPVTPPEASDVLVLPGEELTSAGYHLAVVGLSSTIPWRQSLAASASAAHAQGAIAILAHPTTVEFQRRLTDEGLRAMDGVEVGHPGTQKSARALRESEEIYRQALALNPRVAAIGSSDFHYFRPLGVCRTYVFVRERTAAGVLEAIRAGRTVSCDGRGRAKATVHGPPDLASVVAERCRDDMSAPPDGDTVASRAGTALAWAALVALVLLGPRSA